MGKLHFQSLASGSSGNCYYIGNTSCGFLIDAGIGARTIRKRLKSIGVGIENIWGVFVTHDHLDHIRGVATLGEKFNIPIYATAKVHAGIDRNYRITEKLSTSKKFFETKETLQIGDFLIHSFPVSHDASESVGYSVEYKEKLFTFATDLGYVGEEAVAQIKKSNYLLLEANYDKEMLINGTYPDFLKERIMGNTGHLSNEQAAACLIECYHDDLSHVFLCHLSKENNLPDLAHSTISQQLEKQDIRIGEDLNLIVLDRLASSELYSF